MSGARSRLALAALVVLSTLASLSGAELVLRGTHLVRRLDRPLDARWPWLVSDPFLLWKNAPGYEQGPWRINAFGLRGSELATRKPAETLRILCQGDSGTFGVFLRGPEAVGWDSYPELLKGALLARAARPVEVVNAGVLGYAALNGLRQLELALLGFEPDVLVLRFGLNDHATDEHSGFAFDDPESAWLRHGFYLLARLELGRLAAYAWAPVGRRLGPQGRVRRSTPERFASHLRQLVDVATAAGTRVILLDYPIRPLGAADDTLDQGVQFLYGVSRPQDLYAMHEAYQRVVRRLAADARVPLVETAAVFASSPEPPFSAFDRVHPNDVGARLIAETVAQWLATSGWLAMGPG
jgi:lysophospholipase L1-like esterase